jgi:PAS domain S-box-containing protein
MPQSARIPASRLLAMAGWLLAGLVLLAAGWGLWEARAGLNDRQAERQALLTRVLEDHASRSIDAALLALGGIGDLAARGAAPELLEPLLAQTQASQPTLRGVAVLDASGLVLAAASSSERGIRIRPSALGPWPQPGRDAIGRVVAARSLTSLSVALPKGSSAAPAGVAFIPVMRTVALPNGRVITLVALLNPDALANFQQLTLGDEHSAAALLGLDGQVLAATANAERLPGQTLSGLEAIDRVSANLEFGRWSGPGLRAGPQLASFRALRGRPLLVVVETAQEQLQQIWLKDLRNFGLLAVAAAVALLALSLSAASGLRGRERSRRQLDHAQRRIAAREQELSAVFSSVQDLLFRADANGRLTLVNEGFSAFVGRPMEALVGRPMAEVFDPSAELLALFDPSTETPTPQARRALATMHDFLGRLHNFEVSIVPLPRPDGAVEWVGSAVDITEIVQAQAELRAQLGLARSMLSSSPLPMSVLDRQGRYLDVNRAWEQFTGRSRDDVLGRRAGEAALHAEKDQLLLEHGGEARYEAPWRSDTGQPRDLFISKSTFPDAEGRPAGIVACVMDISEFREADRATRAARDAALQASQAKTEFIANVSHELRTPLQSILGFSELGQLRARAHPVLAEMFGDVHSAGQRMLALVNDLLDLSKIENTAGEALHPERLDLRQVVASIASELRPQLAARQLSLSLDQAAEPLVTLADEPRIGQVLRNVLANAIKFSSPGGEIELHSRAALGKHDDLDAFEGDGVLIEVADRGPGIPAGELESVFEAFVQSSTTNDGSGGTGLGLAICRRLLRAHGGRIWAANREGGGAVLSLWLPAAQFGETRPSTL